YADNDPDNDPNTPAPSPPTHWIAGTQGTLLPEGIYFDPGLSATGSLSSVWNEDQYVMGIAYPRAVSKPQDGADSQQFYYYEFNSNGTMASGFSNSALVIRAGTLKPDGSGSYEIESDEDESKKYIASALIFRRVGTSTLVTDPSAIID
ncbi:MAG: hypothetical protein ACPGES_10880, partial [Coraliomargarita sp.]